MDDSVLAERSNTGLTVQLHWIGDDLFVSVHTDTDYRIAQVDPSEAWEAFIHPMVRVKDPGVFA